MVVEQELARGRVGISRVSGRSKPKGVQPAKSHSIQATVGPQNVSKRLKTSLTAKVTVKNAFADLGKHTHVVRNAFAKAIGGGSVLIG